MTIPKGFVELKTEKWDGPDRSFLVAADSVASLAPWRYTDYDKPKLKTAEGHEYRDSSNGCKITLKTGFDLYTIVPISVVSALISEALTRHPWGGEIRRLGPSVWPFHRLVPRQLFSGVLIGYMIHGLGEFK